MTSPGGAPGAPADARALRAVLVVAVLLAVGGAAWALLPSLLSAAGGPEVEVLALLRAAEQARAAMPVAGGTDFRPRTLRFDRVSVQVDGARAAAFSTLDATGTFGEASVSSLGRERTGFVREGRRWRVDGPLAPALGGALALLGARARALSGDGVPALASLVRPEDRERALGDARLSVWLAAPERRWEPRALFLRSERDEVLVTEEASVDRGRGAPEARITRLRIVPSALTQGFVFAGGVL